MVQPEGGFGEPVVYDLSNILSRYVLEYYNRFTSGYPIVSKYYTTRQHELEYFIDGIYEKDGTKSNIPITFNNSNFKLYVSSGYATYYQTVILKIRIKDRHYEWEYPYGEYFYPVELKFGR